MIARVLVLAAFSVAGLLAQTGTLVNTKDPGVARAVLIDKPDVRVLRVEIQPGATRSLHTHDDVRAHLFLPITGSIELTMGSTKVVAPPGQAYRMDKGTVHGFKNTGTSVAMVFEVFLKEGSGTAAKGNGKPENAQDILAAAFGAGQR